MAATGSAIVLSVSLHVVDDIALPLLAGSIAPPDPAR